MVEMAKECGAVDTVISAVDTIVVSEDGEKITSIPVQKTEIFRTVHLRHLKFQN